MGAFPHNKISPVSQTEHISANCTFDLEPVLEQVLELLELRRNRIIKEFVADLDSDARHEARVDLGLEREVGLSRLLQQARQG